MTNNCDNTAFFKKMENSMEKAIEGVLCLFEKQCVNVDGDAAPLLLAAQAKYKALNNATDKKNDNIEKVSENEENIGTNPYEAALIENNKDVEEIEHVIVEEGNENNEDEEVLDFNGYELDIEKNEFTRKHEAVEENLNESTSTAIEPEDETEENEVVREDDVDVLERVYRNACRGYNFTTPIIQGCTTDDWNDTKYRPMPELTREQLEAIEKQLLPEGCYSDDSNDSDDVEDIDHSDGSDDSDDEDLDLSDDSDDSEDSDDSDEDSDDSDEDSDDSNSSWDDGLQSADEEDEKEDDFEKIDDLNQSTETAMEPEEKCCESTMTVIQMEEDSLKSDDSFEKIEDLSQSTETALEPEEDVQKRCESTMTAIQMDEEEEEGWTADDVSENENDEWTADYDCNTENVIHDDKEKKENANEILNVKQNSEDNVSVSQEKKEAVPQGLEVWMAKMKALSELSVADQSKMLREMAAEMSTAWF